MWLHCEPEKRFFVTGYVLVIIMFHDCKQTVKSIKKQCHVVIHFVDFVLIKQFYMNYVFASLS